MKIPHNIIFVDHLINLWELQFWLFCEFVSFINWMSVKKRSQIGYKETLKNITNDKTVTDYRIWPQIWTLMQYMSINEIYKKTLSRVIETWTKRSTTLEATTLTIISPMWLRDDRSKQYVLDGNSKYDPLARVCKETITDWI
jgi:hypothetical protein